MEGHWIKQSENNKTIVWLHGFLSSGSTAWLHENGTDWPVLISEDPLIKPFGHYVFTYQTSITSSDYSIDDVVDSLKEFMSIDGVIDSNEIIFVCHSMGGIVARRYIVERVAELVQRKIRIGLFLIASPSLGSNYANYMKFVSKAFNHYQAKALQIIKSNEWLAALNKSFLTIKEEGRISIYGKEIVEDRFVILKWLWLIPQVVKPISGAIFFGNPVRIPNTDHFTICKVSDQNTYQHKLLTSFILENNSIKKAQIFSAKTATTNITSTIQKSLKIESIISKPLAGGLKRSKLYFETNHSVIVEIKNESNLEVKHFAVEARIPKNLVEYDPSIPSDSIDKIYTENINNQLYPMQTVQVELGKLKVTNLNADEAFSSQIKITIYADKNPVTTSINLSEILVVRGYPDYTQTIKLRRRSYHRKEVSRQIRR